MNVLSRSTKKNKKLQELSHEMQRQAHTDDLTQLGNRRSINQKLTELTQSFSDRPNELHIALIDVDYFKVINDQFGHDAGDKVLQVVAQLLQKNIRSGDYIGRWGGEEFLLMMPGVSQDTAINICTRIHDALRTYNYPHQQPLTASFGLCSNAQNESEEHLVSRADKQLYLAKASGRDCIYYNNNRI